VAPQAIACSSVHSIGSRHGLVEETWRKGTAAIVARCHDYYLDCDKTSVGIAHLMQPGPDFRAYENTEGKASEAGQWATLIQAHTSRKPSLQDRVLISPAGGLRHLAGMLTTCSQALLVGTQRVTWLRHNPLTLSPLKHRQKRLRTAGEDRLTNLGYSPTVKAVTGMYTHLLKHPNHPSRKLCRHPSAYTGNNQQPRPTASSAAQRHSRGRPS
jgi:hypothetical protein